MEIERVKRDKKGEAQGYDFLSTGGSMLFNTKGRLSPFTSFSE